MRVTFRSFIWLGILFVIALGAVYFFNRNELERATAARVEITTDTFAGTSSLQEGQVVRLTGTVDQLNTVTFYSDRDTKKVAGYFSPLKEYGKSFVVQIPRQKRTSETQVFEGTIYRFSNVPNGARIRKALNGPVELSETESLEFDSETKGLLIEDTTLDFSSNAFVLVDGDVPNEGNIYATILFWAIVSTVAISTAFRRFIFR